MLGLLKTEAQRQLIRRRRPDVEIGRGTVMTNVELGRHVGIGRHCDLADVAIGDYSYLGPCATAAHASIGRFCSIARDVSIGSGSHPSRGTISTHPAFYLSRPAKGWSFASQDARIEYQHTTIGNDVWLGVRVVIRDGITVGDGAIVGAGAVVVKDLAPYGIYGGVPARLIRFRFAPERIEHLLRLRWWDKDEMWLREHAALFMDADAFAHALPDA